MAVCTQHFKQNEDINKGWGTAPHAVAVHGTTADLPRTQLWALLYGQVRQTGDKDFRANLGLPLTSPLSVLVVETRRQITNILQHASRFDKSPVAEAADNLVTEDDPRS